jgi:hypothetical protein
MSRTIVLKLEQHVILTRVLFLEFLTAVSIKIMAYSNVKLYSLVIQKQLVDRGWRQLDPVKRCCLLM